MAVRRVVLSTPALGPMHQLMAEHPRVRVEGTPLGRLLIVHITNAGGADSVRALLPTRFLFDGDDGGGIASAVIDVPEQASAFLHRVESKGLSLLPPIVWERDRMRFRLLAIDDEGAGAAKEVLAGAKLESKSVLDDRELEQELSSSGLMLPSLTKRQAEAVLDAFDSGYYEAPRRVTTEDIARQMGVARSTFEEHLKAAESKLVGALAPIVRMRLVEREKGKEAVGAEALKVYARFSEELGLYVNLAMRGGKVTNVGLSEDRPEGSRGGANPYLARIIRHISTGEDDLSDIPLDLPITPFERDVLELLRTVPSGEVITYGELARRLGRPKASRAVGHACARNPAVIVVPCHRVVPSSGGLGNYSAPGGASTKRKLLEREGAIAKVRQA